LETLLTITSLSTCFEQRQGLLKAVNDVSLSIKKGETLALVGESGSGKSMTALSIMRLVPAPGRITHGRVELHNQNLLELSEKEMTHIRGNKIGLILQDPLSALNPVMRIGRQISEVLRRHFSMSKREAKSKSLDLMERVHLPAVDKLYSSYPHELSGGLRQRVLIAIALAGEPDILIADEPTTALDVSVQRDILNLLEKLKHDLHLSLLLITHDLGVVAQVADRVAVMYAGSIVEQAPKDMIFKAPLHPYTEMLLRAVPKIENRFNQQEESQNVLHEGPPDLSNLHGGCPFHPRCNIADEICQRTTPNEIQLQDQRKLKCFKRTTSHEKNVLDHFAH